MLVVGTGFFNIPNIQCRFGTFSPTEGTYLASSLILCTSSNNGTYGYAAPVEIDPGSGEYTSDGVQYRFDGMGSILESVVLISSNI